MHIIIVDHQDSFTYNVHTYILDILPSARVDVIDFRDMTVALADTADAIILSPGPGAVENSQDIGNSLEIIRHSITPLLGVCLGHQALGFAYGAQSILAPTPMHGRTSWIKHDGQDLFAGLTSPLEVVRYHSRAITNIPAEFDITARADDTTIMAIRHRSKPQWGVQFHPESIGGFDGHRLIENFLNLAKNHKNSSSQCTVAHPAPPKPIAKVHSGYRVEVKTIEGCVDPLNITADPVYLLDSTDPHHRDGRWSYLGIKGGPFAREVQGWGAARNPGGQGNIELLEDALIHADTSAVRDLELSFSLGFVGYFGYEVHDALNPEDHPAALHFVLSDRALAFDHRSKKTHILYLTKEGAAKANLAQHHWARRMAQTVSATSPHYFPTNIGKLTAWHSEVEYLAAIQRAQEYIAEGDSYEVCLTTQLTATIDSFDPRSCYAQFRNRTPLGAWLNFSNTQVMSSSPERFLHCDQDGVIESRPIKGTRARSYDPREDQALRNDLLSHPKDRAENLMIVDLVRNDLARIAQPGTVVAAPLFEVESFASTHQLVSTVRAQRAPGVGISEIMRATFPGGSMTGAPKERTMRIISELEKGPRGIYSGALGYFSCDGQFDLSMVIRTLVISGGQARYGVGGAIVAQSDPVAEYAEIMTKARPLTDSVAQDFPRGH
ncbi:aminodeoxychorismate synthase component I [Corynebacterium sp. ES2730-CONJ]|uniref:aminodeoxychorismate synthase component I n=1 Tax=Corynebacterium sp. ES2730-CONJ TaxID=2973941 RepID=UPI00216ABB6E|nr:aminodeoxychorismate synthase component I [Corynebacterium sp. ES2730-CONJ]MCS4531808.1 aminodeoxychorismate synthase component I [Corynebacterium sp. ES2730-CONJ]